MTGIQCDLCSFQAQKTEDIQSHKLSVHSDLRPWKCNHPGCRYESKLKKTLQRHERLHESDPLLRKPFACAFKGCDYRGSHKLALNSHVKNRHTPGRKREFPCTLCSSRFYHKSNLHSHIRNHVKEKKFECNLCKYKTHRGSILREHVRNMHERRTVTCSFPGCNFSTNIKSSLSRHMKRHSPNPAARHAISCTFAGCEYRAETPYWLKVHIRIQHNPNRVKEFCCRLCPKAFYDSSTLNYHVRCVHLKENFYRCKKCSYTSGSLFQLKRHDGKMHEKSFGMFGFICERCDYRSVSKAGLASHMRKTCLEPREFQHLEDTAHPLLKRNRKGSAFQNLICRNIPFVPLRRIDIKFV